MELREQIIWHIWLPMLTKICSVIHVFQHEASVASLCDSTSLKDSPVDLLSNGWNADNKDGGTANTSHHSPKLPNLNQLMFSTLPVHPPWSQIQKKNNISTGWDNCILVNQFKELISASRVTFPAEQIRRRSELKHPLSPEGRTGTGSCWVSWRPGSQRGPARCSRARPEPNGGTARRRMPRIPLLSDTRGQLLPGCRS